VLAHGVAGERFFPATLAVDDPAVADELSLPTIAILKNADNARQVDLSFEYSKRIEVTDETGRRLRTGPAITAPGNPAVLVVRLSALPAGTYRVTWHVVSMDTHRTQGSFSFQVGP
jgi:methionine-rich copper-binding protein CopC